MEKAIKAKIKIEMNEDWYAILGSITGVCEVVYGKKEALRRVKKGYDSKNKIVPCTITYFKEISPNPKKK